jgi:hypothetical protein
MTANLTNISINESFDQLLHVSDGPTATEKVVYSGTGVATALHVGTVSASVGDVRFSGDTITTITTDADLVLDPNGTGVVDIARVAFGDEAQARGALSLGTIATQDSDDVDITGGSITGVVFTGSFTGITLIESQAFHTVNGGDGLEIENTSIVADGTSADISISITPKGTGAVDMGGKFGYTTGIGGTVTQITSKATGVTLNKVSGQITMHDAQVSRNSGVSFTLTNSFIAATDVVIVNIASGATPSAYTATVDAVAAGSCVIHLHNHLTGTDLSEAVVLNFVVIKGVHS